MYFVLFFRMQGAAARCARKMRMEQKSQIN